MDFEPVLTLPEPIGSIPGVLGSSVAIYGRRRKYLPMRKGWFEQVRVAGWGGLYWINTGVTLD